ncbi:hypothetical protein HN814_09520 [Candidatus Woesearchaeota archaeon]|nr:hypothetical protein [Candidatus Woesearchaeota archaeon]
MKKRIFFFIIVLIIVFSSFSLALSISGKPLSKVLFVPGQEIVNEYTVRDTRGNIEMNLNGDKKLLKFISIKEVSKNKFLLNIKFPKVINVEPGIYRMGVYAQEKSGSDGAVGVSLGVEKVIFIHVYSKEKNIEASLNAPSVNIGDDMEIDLNVESRTYSDISNVKAKVKIMDSSGGLIANLDSGSLKLDSLGEISFKIPFNSENLVQGNYLAVADVSYDELKVQVNDSFDVGKLDLKLVNYPRQIPKGFAQVDIDVKNNWGNSLNNVYAKLVVDGKEIFQTPTINLGAWEQGKLSAIGNFDFPYGDYNSQIILFFEGQSKVEKIKLSIIENEIIEEMNSDQLKSSNYTNTILITTVLIIMLIVIVMLLVKFRHKSKVEDEEEF